MVLCYANFTTLLNWTSIDKKPVSGSQYSGTIEKATQHKWHPLFRSPPTDREPVTGQFVFSITEGPLTLATSLHDSRSLGYACRWANLFEVNFFKRTTFLLMVNYQAKYARSICPVPSSLMKPTLVCALVQKTFSFQGKSWFDDYAEKHLSCL